MKGKAERHLSFDLHAVAAVLALCALNLLIAFHVPFAIEQIGSSYLIFFYHFPAAINVFAFYGFVFVASVFFLATRDAAWDRRARAACEVGLLANAVLLATGSAWAKAAWNVWWNWNDPRLMSAAVMSLSYVGYLALQAGLEESEKRPTYAAVLGVLAFLNIPIVHYSIHWFGEVSHPKALSPLSDPEIVQTRWFGVLAFFVFYSLLCRWRAAGLALAGRAQAVSSRLRMVEEGANV